MRRFVLAATAALAGLALAVPTIATAKQDASVVDVTYGGGSTVEVLVAIPQGINTATRRGNANWGLRVTATYVSQNNTVETVDSGRVSVADTVFLANDDEHTAVVAVSVPLGATPAPGTNPSFSATAELLYPGGE